MSKSFGVVGIRESVQVLLWAVTRVNAELATKHTYMIAPIANRPYVGVRASEEALEALYASLTDAGCTDFKVGNLPMHEATAYEQTSEVII